MFLINNGRARWLPNLDCKQPNHRQTSAIHSTDFTKMKGKKYQLEKTVSYDGH